MINHVKGNSKLYYNESLNTFSTTQILSCNEVFEPFDCKNKEKKFREINLGIYKLRIFRGNLVFSREGAVQWLWIDIYVHDIILLPISMSCRKADIHYKFSEHEIAFLQYGGGHNNGMSPHTYMQARKNVDWDEALDSIVEICNNYNDWIIQETEKLLSSLSVHKKYTFRDIATLLCMVRRYDRIVPNIIPTYRKYVDGYCFGAMSELIKQIKETQLAKGKHYAIYGDIIWGYIKDYYLDVPNEINFISTL